MSCIICIALKKKYGKYDLAISKDNPLTEHHVAPKTGIPLCRTCHDIVEGKKRRKTHIRYKIMEIINELGITKFRSSCRQRTLEDEELTFISIKDETYEALRLLRMKDEDDDTLIRRIVELARCYMIVQGVEHSE